MRKPPNRNGVELKPPQVTPDLHRRWGGSKPASLITQVRQYELITPLFGGGVVPGMADPETVIRGTAIRGHLRFWWRACRGGQFNGDLARMKEAEDKLWGAASTEKKASPSQVLIVITEMRPGTNEKPYEARTKTAEGWRDLAYAAFPLAPEDNRSLQEVRRGVKFTLRITYPSEQQAEVAAALWAWETFGGIGARTRRGFGALRLVKIDGEPVVPPSGKSVEEAIRFGLRQHVVAGNWPGKVPHLDREWGENVGKITRPQTSADEAWKLLVKKLKSFRQARSAGSNTGSQQRPGRSKWPEPDAIRRILNSNSPGHEPSPKSPDKFPRAAFGLPIIFKFKDEGGGDPKVTTLQGQEDERQRYASPHILRPLACSGGQAVGLAVVLQGSAIPKLVLKGAPGDPEVEALLTRADAGNIPPLDGNTDVLQAFLKTL